MCLFFRTKTESIREDEELSPREAQDPSSPTLGSSSNGRCASMPASTISRTKSRSRSTTLGFTRASGKRQRVQAVLDCPPAVLPLPPLAQTTRRPGQRLRRANHPYNMSTNSLNNYSTRPSSSGSNASIASSGSSRSQSGSVSRYDLDTLPDRSVSEEVRRLYGMDIDIESARALAGYSKLADRRQRSRNFRRDDPYALAFEVGPASVWEEDECRSRRRSLLRSRHDADRSGGGSGCEKVKSRPSETVYGSSVGTRRLGESSEQGSSRTTTVLGPVSVQPLHPSAGAPEAGSRSSNIDRKGKRPSRRVTEYVEAKNMIDKMPAILESEP